MIIKTKIKKSSDVLKGIKNNPYNSGIIESFEEKDGKEISSPKKGKKSLRKEKPTMSRNIETVPKNPGPYPDEDMEKAKKMPIGTVAKWGEQTYKKISENNWQVVSEKKESKNESKQTLQGIKEPGKDYSSESEVQSLEKKALESVSTPDKLKKLFDKKVVEIINMGGKEGDAARKAFKGARFDFDKKQLISNDGRLALEWRTRHFPQAPSGIGNKQTAGGWLGIVKLNQEKSIVKTSEYNNAVKRIEKATGLEHSKIIEWADKNKVDFPKIMGTVKMQDLGKLIRENKPFKKSKKRPRILIKRITRCLKKK